MAQKRRRPSWVRRRGLGTSSALVEAAEDVAGGTHHAGSPSGEGVDDGLAFYELARPAVAVIDNGNRGNVLLVVHETGSFL